MAILNWYETIEQISSHVFNISTTRGFGTGFLLTYLQNNDLCAVATAAHVVDHAHYWEDPIRILHYSSGESLMVKPDKRAVIIYEKQDTAIVVFAKNNLPIPKQAFPLTPEEKWVKVGVEAGWLGFPSITRNTMCFFSGRISAYLKDEQSYLVDGVAINGVSGGPTFIRGEDKDIVLMGVVSAYLPNKIEDAMTSTPFLYQPLRS